MSCLVQFGDMNAMSNKMSVFPILLPRCMCSSLSELLFLAQLKASNCVLKSLTNMTLSERLLMVSKSLRFGILLGQ